MFPRLPVRSSLLFSGSLLVIAAGCSSSLFNSEWLKPSTYKPPVMEGLKTEQRVISLFTDALAEDNEPAFRRIVSTRFEQKAMRSPDSFRDLEILNLPETRLEVVESKELSEGRMETVAREEKDGKKFQFIIVRDEAKHRWVVDDVMIRQQKKGTRATKSSVEVMDLLLTVREFLGIWQSADREAVLAALSPELRESMETLPEAWMQRLIATVTAEYETNMARRPEAQMNESDAVVKMPAKHGFILMKVVRDDEVWLVSDIEVRKRNVDDYPGSVLRQSRAIHAVSEFLACYKAGDHTMLEDRTDPAFFSSSLKNGDLSIISLPDPAHAPDDFEIQSFAGQLTVMIPDQQNVVRVDLITAQPPGQKASTSTDVEGEFLISNVTVYDRATQQQQSLKSAFTAPARAMLFMAALQSRDLPVLRQTSTADLRQRVWSRLNEELAASLSASQIPAGTLTLQHSDVRGEVTELQFLSSSGQLCSVIMREENGGLKVDDVQYPDPHSQVASLKSQLALTIPVMELASAWQRHDLNAVRTTTSLDFNRLVWSNLTGVPRDFERIPDLLLMPVASVRNTDERHGTVELREPGHKQILVSLVRENSAWVVDEIAMPQPDGTTMELRKTLRQSIAQQFLSDPSGQIRTAAYEVNGDGVSGVIRAGGTPEDRPRGNLTMPVFRNSRESVSRQGIDMTPPEVTRETRSEDANVENSEGRADFRVQRFGPNAAASGREQPKAATPVVSRLPARPKARTIERDGVVYFQGADAGTEASGEADTAAEVPPQEDSPGISDPSQYPIEIPMN